MSILRTLLFRAIVMVTLISPCIYLTYGGKGNPSIAYMVRNVTWNDFIAQIASYRTNLHKILSAKKCGLSKSFSKRMKAK
jgi:hypothetical protein